MFLRRNRRRSKTGELYEYWTLVKTVRTERGPRQQVVATLGKEPGLERGSRRRWEDVAALLEGRDPPPRQLELDEEVDVSGLRVERVREFGQVYLALALWRRLGLHTLLEEIISAGRESVPWELVACTLTVARFCGNKSELEG